MDFKNWFTLNEDIFPNKTAVVYHRTNKLNKISNILVAGFSPGSGDYYGSAMYTTFNLQSQFTGNMCRYGEYIIKFKVSDLDKYLIFHLSAAKYILGNQYSLESQFKKFNIQVADEVLKEYEEIQKKIYPFSGELCKRVYEDHPEIQKKCKGVIVYGTLDGYVLAKYNPVNDGTIQMIAYAKAECDDIKKFRELYSNKGWNTSTIKASIKSIDADNINKDKKKDFVELNSEIRMKLISLLDDDKDRLLKNYLKSMVFDDYKIIKLIIKYKKNISASDIDFLITNIRGMDIDVEGMLINKITKSYNFEFLKDLNKISFGVVQNLFEKSIILKNYDFAKKLIKAYAYGDSPEMIYFLITQKNYDMLKYFLEEHNIKKIVLGVISHLISQGGDINMAKLLIKHGATVEHDDIDKAFRHNDKELGNYLKSVLKPSKQGGFAKEKLKSPHVDDALLYTKVNDEIYYKSYSFSKEKYFIKEIILSCKDENNNEIVKKFMTMMDASEFIDVNQLSDGELKLVLQDIEQKYQSFEITIFEITHSGKLDLNYYETEKISLTQETKDQLSIGFWKQHENIIYS